MGNPNEPGKSQGGQGGQGQQANQAGQSQPGQGQGQGQGQNYVVKAEFTDEKGKKWTAGTAFTGDEAAARKALAAGQIEARPKPTQQPA
jgi:hypothetical protein